MKYAELAPEVITVCEAFIPRLQHILGDKLYGIYMYGASMFPESGRATDIDCHIVLNTSLNSDDRDAIGLLYADMAERFPPLGAELDIWYILLEDARKTEPPQNRLKTEMFDTWWALHCAHIRAGRFITLAGPAPDDIFPEPSWEAIETALDHEIDFINRALEYPHYCVLNLCRILYSFRNRHVVVSKRFSGGWAKETYPQWQDVIEAAIHTYEDEAAPDETKLLEDSVGSFLEFALTHIDEARERNRNDG